VEHGTAPAKVKFKNVDSAMMPTNQYVEVRNRAYYLSRTRIGLDVIIREFRDGRSPEEIFEAFASIGSLSTVYGAITFILEHPQGDRFVSQRAGREVGSVQTEQSAFT
jgi:hypothetical protein